MMPSRQNSERSTIAGDAGVSEASHFIDIPVGNGSKVFYTNLLGVYLTVREGVKRLIASDRRDKESGRIIFIGSITAEMRGRGDAAFAATKTSVAHLCRHFEREWLVDHLLRPGAPRLPCLATAHEVARKLLQTQPKLVQILAPTAWEHDL